jgi:P-type Ca2+ transporter type 2B
MAEHTSEKLRKGGTKFSISPKDLVNLVELYKGRTFDEDIKALRENFDGTENLASQLCSDTQHGITTNNLKERDRIYGSNSSDSSKGIFSILLKILIYTGTLSLALSMVFKEGQIEISLIKYTTLLDILMFSSMVNLLNTYLNSKYWDKFNASEYAQSSFEVMRDGRKNIISFDDLKVGDLVKIKAGMIFPCDGVLVSESELLVNESTITEETSVVKKWVFETCENLLRDKVEEENSSNLGFLYRSKNDIPSPILLSGTQIENGEGWIIVITVGNNSCYGKIINSLNTTIKRTPLQHKLEVYSNGMRKIAMLIAGITVLWLLVRLFIQIRSKEDNWEGNVWSNLWNIFAYIIFGIMIFCMAVPKGVSLVTMISLAYSVKNMLQDMNLVKRLSSIEALGSFNCIVSDKTGTLTKSEMCVVKFWQGYTREFNVEDYNYKLEDYLPNNKASELFLQGCACNCLGSVDEGNATETAILKMLKKFGCDYENLRAKHLKDQFVRFNFTSRRKKMGTILSDIQDNEFGYNKRLYVKGASEIILTSCSHYIDEDGNKREISDHQDIIKNVIEHFAYESLRTICLAYKDLKEGEGGSTHEDEHEDGVNRVVEKSGFTCVAIFGIWDVIRPGIPSVVKTCQKAGIRVRMVTGDNKITAFAVGKQWNIVQSDHTDAIMEGPEFCERVGGLYCANCQNKTPWNWPEGKVDEKIVNKEEFIKIVEHLDILSRSRPEDKYVLVAGLKEMGDVVAVTGDGTNDAPALKKADVGFVMGIIGTEIAKSAADIILLDDNFTSIVKACMWGRNIYDNIRRFIQFQLIVNFVTLILMIIFALIIENPLLQPIQLFWMNIIMGSLASFAYSAEPPKSDSLNRPPNLKGENIISKNMAKYILSMSLYQLAVVLLITLTGENWIQEPQSQRRGFEIKDTSGASYKNSEIISKNIHETKNSFPSKHSTVIFTVLSFLQIFTLVAWRKLNGEMNAFEGLSKNLLFCIIWGSTLILIILVTQFGQDLFFVCAEGLDLSQWAIWFLIGISVLPFGWLIGSLGDKEIANIDNQQRNTKVKLD